MRRNDTILEWLKSDCKVCIYGLGYLGRRLYKEVSQMFDIHINIYSDSDKKKVDSTNLPDMQGVYAEELLNMKEDIVVFVMVDDPYDDEIATMLSVNEYLHIVTLREVTNLDMVIRKFYGEKIYNQYVGLPMASEHL